MGSMKDAFGDRPYPVTPGYKEPTTAKAAATAINSRAGTLRARALDEIRASGDAGLTADEVATRLNETVLAIRPRLSELNVGKQIEPTGDRRRNASGLSATVWRIRRAG